LPYVVNTATDRFSGGQIHRGSDPVPPAVIRGGHTGRFGLPATGVPVSGATANTSCGVGRRHSRSVRPRATLDQLCLGWADRGSSTRTPIVNPAQNSCAISWAAMIW